MLQDTDEFIGWGIAQVSRIASCGPMGGDIIGSDFDVIMEKYSVTNKVSKMLVRNKIPFRSDDRDAIVHMVTVVLGLQATEQNWK